MPLSSSIEVVAIVHVSLGDCSTLVLPGFNAGVDPCGVSYTTTPKALATEYILGVRVDQIPVTPEKILRALQAKAAGKAARSGPGAFPDIAWPDPLLVAPPWEGGDGRASNEPSHRSGRKADAGVEAAAGVRP